MDPLLIHDTFTWIRTVILNDYSVHPTLLPFLLSSSLQHEPEQRLSSFQETIHPTILLYLLSKIIPSVPNEPDMGKIQGDPESLLTVYLNGCKRLGIIHLFSIPSHPLFATGNHSTTISTFTHTTMSNSTGSGNNPEGNVYRRSSLAENNEDSISTILYNLMEVRIMMETKLGISHSSNKPNTINHPNHIPSSYHQCLPTVESRLQINSSSTDPSIPSSTTTTTTTTVLPKPSLTTLTYAEHCALYTGTLTNDISPAGRERLWKWLFLYESQYINNCMNTRSQALAATRRINEARKMVGSHGSIDDQLVLLHMLNSPGHGIVLLRRKLLRALVRYGIPPIYRGRLWACFLNGGDEMDISNYLQENIFYHHRYSSLRNSHKPSVSSSSSTKLIEAMSQDELKRMNTVTTLTKVPSHPIQTITDTLTTPASVPSLTSSTATDPLSSLIDRTKSLFSLYDRLLLCNSLYLGENYLPCHLLTYIHYLKTTLSAENIQTLLQNLTEDYRTVVPASSPIPDTTMGHENSNTELWLSVYLTEFVPITNKTMNQINVDLRRTLLNLTPLETSRIHYSPSDRSSMASSSSVYGYPIDTVPANLPHHPHRSSRTASFDANEKVHSHSPRLSEPYFTVSHIHTSRYHYRFQNILNDPRYRTCFHRSLSSSDRFPYNSVPSSSTLSSIPSSTGTSPSMDHNPLHCTHASYAQFVQTVSRSSSSLSSSTDTLSSLSDPTKSVITVNIESIRRVLVAFASYVPAIGYCQGLNWLVSHLLRWVSEPDAFCLLTLLVTQVFSPNTFTDLSGAETDTHIFSEILLSSLPIVVNHFGKLLAFPAGIGKSPSASNLNPSHTSPSSSSSSLSSSALHRDPQPALDMIKSIILKWFVVGFANPFPPSFTDRVWDSVLYEGSKTLFRTALALTRLITPRILAARTLPDALSIFDRLPVWCKHRRIYIAMFDVWIWPPSIDYSNPYPEGKNRNLSSVPLSPVVASNIALRTPLRTPPIGNKRVNDGNRTHTTPANGKSQTGKGKGVTKPSRTATIRPSSRPLSSQDGTQVIEMDNDTSSRNNSSDRGSKIPDTKTNHRPSVPRPQNTAPNTNGSIRPPPVTSTTLGLRLDRKDIGHGISGASVSWLLSEHDRSYGSNGNTDEPLTNSYGKWTGTVDDYAIETYGTSIDSTFFQRDKLYTHGHRTDKMSTSNSTNPTRSRQSTVTTIDESKVNGTATDDDPNSTILSMDSLSQLHDITVTEPNDTYHDVSLRTDDDDGTDDHRNGTNDNGEEAENQNDNDDDDQDYEGYENDEEGNEDNDDYIEEDENEEEEGKGDEVEIDDEDNDQDIADGETEYIADDDVENEPRKDSLSETTHSSTIMSDSNRFTSSRNTVTSTVGSVFTEEGSTANATPTVTKKHFAGNIARRYGGGGGRKSTPRYPPISSATAAVTPLESSPATGLTTRALIARGLVVPNEENAGTTSTVISEGVKKPSLPSSFRSHGITLGLVWREREYISGLYIRSRRVYVRNMLAQVRLQRFMEDQQQEKKPSSSSSSFPTDSVSETVVAPTDITNLPSWLQHRLDCANGERMPLITDGNIDEDINQDTDQSYHDPSAAVTTHSSVSSRSPAPSGGHSNDMFNPYENSNNKDEESAALLHLQPTTKHGVIHLPPNLSSPIRRQGAAMEVGAPKVEPFGKRLRLLSFFYRDPRSLDRLPYNLAMIENYWKPIDIDTRTGYHTAVVDEVRYFSYGKNEEETTGDGSNDTTTVGTYRSDIPLSRIFIGPIEATVAYRPNEDEDEEEDDASKLSTPLGNPSASSSSSSVGRRRSSIPHTTSLMSFLLGNLSSSASTNSLTAVSPTTTNGGSRPSSLRLSSASNAPSTTSLASLPGTSPKGLSPLPTMNNNTSTKNTPVTKQGIGVTNSPTGIATATPRSARKKEPQETNTVLAGATVFDYYF